jgi:hypothetical protein
MARIALVTVSDEGAAEMVRAALVDAGVQPEFERVYLDHPYRASALAESWRVFVPADRLTDARNALARLEHEMAEEVEAQAMAWQPRSESDPDLPLLPRRWRPSRQAVLWTLALTALFPFLAVCLYARRESDAQSGVPSITRPHPVVPSVLRLFRYAP